MVDLESEDTCTTGIVIAHERGATINIGAQMILRKLVNSIAAGILSVIAIVPATSMAEVTVSPVKVVRGAPGQEMHIQLVTPINCASGWLNLNPAGNGVGTDRLVSIALASMLSGRNVRATWTPSTGTHCTLNYLVLE